MVTGANGSSKRKPRRNVRLRPADKRAKREASFSFRLLCFFVKKIFVIVGFIALTLALIFTHDYLTQTKRLALETIVVEGNFILSDAEVIKAAEVDLGQNILKLNGSIIQRRLLTHTWIKTAEISRDGFRTLTIRITEQDPLFCADLGQIFIVNSDGVVFKPAMAADTLRWPTVRGLNIPAEYWVDAEDFCLWTAKKGISPFEVTKLAALRDFLDMCEANRRIMGLALISDIETDGLMGITAIMRSGRTVKFGFNNMETKFTNYTRFEDFADTNLLQYEIKTVDLRDAARIVVKRLPLATGNKVR